MARARRPTIRARTLTHSLKAISRRQNGQAAPPEPRGHHRRELAHNGLRWIDIILDPQVADRSVVDELGREFGFHPLVLDDLVSRVQRPKLDDDFDDYLFIVLHFPRFNRLQKVAEPSEVDFFLGKDYVITVHNGDLRPLTSFWAWLEGEEEARAKYMGGSAELFLYHIVDRLTNYLFPMMMRIDQNIELLDKRIFHTEDARSAVRDLATLRRDLISLLRIVRPALPVVRRLENGRLQLLDEELQPYWSDVTDHFNRVVDMLLEFQEEIEVFDDTFNTLYSYRINETLRALTLISVVLLPLTLIASIYGMNVGLPGQEEPHSLTAFYAIVSTMAVIGLGMLLFFRRKGWW
jgi:magnesium transporter